MSETARISTVAALRSSAQSRNVFFPDRPNACECPPAKTWRNGYPLVKEALVNTDFVYRYLSRKNLIPHVNQSMTALKASHEPRMPVMRCPYLHRGRQFRRGRGNGAQSPAFQQRPPQTCPAFVAVLLLPLWLSPPETLPQRRSTLLAASLADHLHDRNAQIAGLLRAGCRLRLRFPRLRFVGYEAADGYLMPEVPVKLNGAAA